MTKLIKYNGAGTGQSEAINALKKPGHEWREVTVEIDGVSVQYGTVNCCLDFRKKFVDVDDDLEVLSVDSSMSAVHRIEPIIPFENMGPHYSTATVTATATSNGSSNAPANVKSSNIPSADTKSTNKEKTTTMMMMKRQQSGSEAEGNGKQQQQQVKKQKTLSSSSDGTGDKKKQKSILSFIKKK